VKWSEQQTNETFAFAESLQFVLAPCLAVVNSSGVGKPSWRERVWRKFNIIQGSSAHANLWKTLPFTLSCCITDDPMF